MRKQRPASLGLNVDSHSDRGVVHLTARPSPRVDARSPEAIPPDHRDAVQRGLDQATRGELATEAEVKAVFRRFGA
jgi:hypothetical protein